jgi:hypothetical protein
MWRNYDNGFYAYLVAIYEECVVRGIKADKNWSAIEKLHEDNWNRGGNTVMPAWWGDNRVHESHRNNLYVKDPDYYAEFFSAKRTTCCDRCNYFWPTHTLFYNNDLVGLVI